MQKELEEKMKTAISYDEWKSAALALDQIQSNELWKATDCSSDYDFELIQIRLSQLRIARKENDLHALTFLLRTSIIHLASLCPFFFSLFVGISRTIGDINNQKLYSYSHIGTKYLIDEYIKEVVELLDYCAENAKLQYCLEDQYQLFKNIRVSFGYTALLLSGGASIGAQHIGVVSCLIHQNLLPRIISGSSAGAIIAAMLCTKSDEEFEYFLNPRHLDLNLFDAEIFDTPSDKFYYTMSRFLQQGFAFDSEQLKKTLRNNLGDITFREAYSKTHRVLNITVSSLSSHLTPRMLNHITAPTVVIWSAVAASCSLPKIFKSGKIQSKNSKGKLENWDDSDQSYIDGSIQSDIPTKHLSQLFHVNYFIVSQVNPHIVAFLPNAPYSSWLDSLYRKCLSLIKSELQYRLPSLIDLGIFPDLFQVLLSIIGQRYDGDVTIMPNISLSDWKSLLSNPDEKQIGEAIPRGERVTWPKLSMIRNNVLIEMKLDSILYTLRNLLAEEMPAKLDGSLSDTRNRVRKTSGKGTMKNNSKVSLENSFAHNFSASINEGMTFT